MEKSLLREIVLEQKKYLEAAEEGVLRTMLESLQGTREMPHAVIISGLRRAGKSTLLAQIMKRFYPSGVYYLSFEDERLLNFEVQDFNMLYETFLELFGEKETFFFDEIQNVPRWEAFVRRMQERNFKFFITGSNASLLSKELGTRLTGRSVVLSLYPFSFREFLDFKGVTVSANDFFHTDRRGLLKRHFYQYLKSGGVPEYHKYQDPLLLKRIYEDILYRDIVARHDVKDVHALRELGLYFMTNACGLFSYNNLKKVLRLGSDNTVKSYTGYLEDSYLIFTVSRFSFSLKQQFVAHRKVYCVDNGIMGAVAFQFSKNRGKFLENLVAVELKRRGLEFYYYRTSEDTEIDFLIKEKKTKPVSLIQVTESMENPKSRKRELRALETAMEELGLTSACVLTEDDEEEIKTAQGIVKVVPIYKWLLENDGKSSPPRR